MLPLSVVMHVSPARVHDTKVTLFSQGDSEVLWILIYFSRKVLASTTFKAQCWFCSPWGPDTRSHLILGQPMLLLTVAGLCAYFLKIHPLLLGNHNISRIYLWVFFFQPKASRRLARRMTSTRAVVRPWSGRGRGGLLWPPCPVMIWRKWISFQVCKTCMTRE